MDTRIVVIDEENIDEGLIKEAGDIIKKGGLVAFPTETVYGLGGDGLNPMSSKKIYAAKGRPSDNPLIVHISKWEAIDKIVESVPEEAKKLSDAFWPGPLTMIFKKSAAVPYETTGGLDTVAVRMPSNKIARAFIEAAGEYVAAPSANISGRPSPTVAKYVIEDMNSRIEMIIDGGESEVGLESTIVDLTGDKPLILRPGYVTDKMLSEVLEIKVGTDRAIIDANSKEKPKAPGMKYRHYAPKGELTIIEGNTEKVVARINELTKEAESKGLKVGVIATDETVNRYRAGSVKCAGAKDKEEEIAHSLFRILREFDDEEIDVMFSQSFKGEGVCQAVMNRLLKAAGHHVETV